MAPRERWLLGLLLAGLAVVMLFRLGAGPLQSSAERRVMDVMRGMHDTGDWLVPRENGAVRLNKPPLYYWAATASATLLGVVDHAAVRLPAALATLALVWVTWRWARWLGGPRLALLSAAALSCMELLGSQGRTGVAEMFLALFSTLGLDTFDRMSRRPERAVAPAPAPAPAAQPAPAASRRGLLPLFAVWTTLAILSKATVALMLLGVPAALLLVLQGRWREALSGRVVRWVALAVVAGFAWYVVVLAVVPGAWETLKATLLLPMGVRLPGADKAAAHTRPVTFFITSLLLSCFPVTALVPPMIVRAWRSRLWSGERVRFVALALVSLFVCFSLVPQKQKHYMLPLLPLLAILCAESLLSLELRAPAALRRLLVLLAVIAAALSLPLLFALHLLYVEAMHLPLLAGAAVGLLAAVLLGELLRAALRRHLDAFTAAATIGTLLLLLCYHGSLEVWQRQFEAREVTQRADYDAARWRVVFDEWPVLKGMLRAGSSDG